MLAEQVPVSRSDVRETSVRTLVTGGRAYPDLLHSFVGPHLKQARQLGFDSWRRCTKTEKPGRNRCSGRSNGDKVMAMHQDFHGKVLGIIQTHLVNIPFTNLYVVQNIHTPGLFSR